MKKILLITNYFHLKHEKEINRYRILAEKLAVIENVQLEVITSRFYQRTLEMRNIPDNIINNLPYKLTLIDEPGYSKSVSFKRLKSSKVFAKNVLKYIKTLKEIDLIYQVVPTLDVAFKTSKFAKRRKIPFIIDIQDLWPEAFQIAFNVPILSSLVFLPFKLKANFIYKNANEICAVSKTYVDRAKKVNKKAEGHPVFIGIDLDTIDSYTSGIKRENEKNLIIGYCGSLGNSYDLETVIRALAIIENPPTLLVMGEGEKKEKLELMAKKLGVKVVFTGFIDYSTMSKKLKQCNMVVNPIVGSSVASIINKHGDYAASGLPVLNTQNSKEYIELINEYHMGLNSEPGDANGLARNIIYLVENEGEREIMGNNARKCAEEKFDRKKTYQELIDVIKKNMR